MVFSGIISTGLSRRLSFTGQAAVPALYSKQALHDIHRLLFQKLPVADLMTEHGVAIEPGVLRSLEVSVGRHVAPTVASLAEGV